MRRYDVTAEGRGYSILAAEVVRFSNGSAVFTDGDDRLSLRVRRVEEIVDRGETDAFGGNLHVLYAVGETKPQKGEAAEAWRAREDRLRASGIAAYGFPDEPSE